MSRSSALSSRAGRCARTGRPRRGAACPPTRSRSPNTARRRRAGTSARASNWYLSLSLSSRLAGLPLKMPARYSTLPLASRPQSWTPTSRPRVNSPERRSRSTNCSRFEEVSSCRPSGTLNWPTAIWNRLSLLDVPIEDEVLERARGARARLGPGPAELQLVGQLPAPHPARQLRLGAPDAEAPLRRCRGLGRPRELQAVVRHLVRPAELHAVEQGHAAAFAFPEHVPGSAPPVRRAWRAGLPSSRSPERRGEGLADGAGCGLSWASSAAETPRAGRERPRASSQRAARAHRGADVIAPPVVGRAWSRLYPQRPRPVQRGAVARVSAPEREALAQHVQHAAHDLDVARHQLRERLAVQPEQPRVRRRRRRRPGAARDRAGPALRRSRVRPELDDRARRRRRRARARDDPTYMLSPARPSRTRPALRVARPPRASSATSARISSETSGEHGHRLQADHPLDRQHPPASSCCPTPSKRARAQAAVSRTSALAVVFDRVQHVVPTLAAQVRRRLQRARRRPGGDGRARPQRHFLHAARRRAGPGGIGLASGADAPVERRSSSSASTRGLKSAARVTSRTSSA